MNGTLLMVLGTLVVARPTLARLLEAQNWTTFRVMQLALALQVIAIVLHLLGWCSIARAEQLEQQQLQRQLPQSKRPAAFSCEDICRFAVPPSAALWITPMPQLEQPVVVHEESGRQRCAFQSSESIDAFRREAVRHCGWRTVSSSVQFFLDLPYAWSNE